MHGIAAGGWPTESGWACVQEEQSKNQRSSQSHSACEPALSFSLRFHGAYSLNGSLALSSILTIYIPDNICTLCIEYYYSPEKKKNIVDNQIRQHLIQISQVTNIFLTSPTSNRNRKNEKESELNAITGHLSLNRWPFLLLLRVSFVFLTHVNGEVFTSYLSEV